MSIHLFSASQLARQVRSRNVSGSDRMRYLALSMFIWTIFGATGLLSASPALTWAALLETALYVAITVVGVSSAFRASGGEANSDFIWQFTCFYVPVTISTVAAVWSLYWLAAFFGPELILLRWQSNRDDGERAMRLWSEWAGVLVTIAVLATQAVTLYRITGWLRRLQVEPQ